MRRPLETTRATFPSRTKQQSERGAVLVFVAIMLVVLIGFMALATDVGFMYTAKADLQASVDAAALAGASGLAIGPNEARARAIGFAAKNPVYGQPVELTDADMVFGVWDDEAHTFTELDPEEADFANSIRVTGNLTDERNNPLGLIFARVFGIDQADVRAQSTARAGAEQPWDIVVLQDVTASFTEELDTALDADRGLLTCIANNTGGNSRVGFAVHTGHGKPMTPLWTVDEGFADLSIIIDGVKPCDSKGMPPCSGTDQASGMEAALTIFAESPPNPHPNTQKAIVLVSDGKPNPSGKGAHPKLSEKQLQELALDWADTAWTADISVFTVFYDEDDDDVAADFLEEMTRGVGTFQRTPDPKELDTLLSEVCSALGPGVRLVQ